MFRLKSIGIAVAILCSLFLFGMVNKSAAGITSFYVSANTDWGGGSDFYASLSADADIYSISFSVKQTYPSDEADSDWIHAYSNMYSTGTRSVSEYLGSFDGHIKIAEYDVKAEVWFYDADGNPTTVSDSSETSTSVYKPVVAYDSGYKQTGLYGYSELTAHYYDGSYIVMDGFAWAYNGTGGNASGSGRFRHTAINQPRDELEKDLPGDTIKPGETYGYSTGYWGTYFNYFCGTLTRDNKWHCNAYLRIVVHKGVTDDWRAESTNWFTHEDNR